MACVFATLFVSECGSVSGAREAVAGIGRRVYGLMVVGIGVVVQ